MDAFEVTLAQEIQAKTFLYNVLDVNHKNEDRRLQAFGEVAAIISRTHPEIVEDVDGESKYKFYVMK